MDAVTTLIHDYLIISPKDTFADIRLWVNSNVVTRQSDTDIEARLVILKIYFEEHEEYEICGKIQHILNKQNAIKNRKDI